MTRNKKEKSQQTPPASSGGHVLFRTIGLLMRGDPLRTTLVIIFILISAIIGAMPAIYIETLTSLIEEGLKTGWESIAPRVITTVSIMVGLYLVSLLCITIYTQLMARITQDFLHRMRLRMFSGMQDLPIRYFDRNTTGDIMSHYTNDIDTLRELVSQSLPQILTGSVTILLLLTLMLYFSIPLMIVVSVGILLMLLVTKKVGGNSAKYFGRQQKSIGSMEGYIEEMMNGQKVVKVFCHEKTAEAEFDQVNEQLFSDVYLANKYANIYGPIINNIGNILYVLVAFSGGLLICLDGRIPNFSLMNLIQSGHLAAPLTISVVASYLGMAKQFTGTVNQASQQINSIAMARAGAERIFSLLDQQPETDEGYVTLVRASREPDGSLRETEKRTGLWAWKHFHKAKGTTTYTELRGDIVLEHVDFGYQPDKTILHDISLYAHPGEKIAFVGATGAGKTTITNLINRFYDIPDGKIRYDGINITKIKKADLRRSLGVVLQDVNLFTGTVMENIRYGRLDATDEECIAAAKLANADDFITRLPQGYQTMLSASGSNLSQGQRQLLSIARAAVADPPAMILDEATSSIDTRTEALVQKGMDALMKGRTVFVIAHRLSTVRNSDAIMVLDHGRIIERGNHDALIAQKGVYYQLYTGAFELE